MHLAYRLVSLVVTWRHVRSPTWSREFLPHGVCPLEKAENIKFVAELRSSRTNYHTHNGRLEEGGVATPDYELGLPMYSDFPDFEQHKKYDDTEILHSYSN